MFRQNDNKSEASELKKQMRSFAASFASAIDKRTPYNGSHTRKVALYAELIAACFNKHAEETGGECFDNNRMEQLLLAAYLHDIGKMVIPLRIMNKENRLGEKLTDIENRFEYLKVCFERDMYKGLIDRKTYENEVKYLSESLWFIRETNEADILQKDMIKRTAEIAGHVYVQQDGSSIPYLTDEERIKLNISSGTLSDEERYIMKSHVIMTREILDEVYFTEDYKDVPGFATAHHELLDGSGYPGHLSGDKLATEVRILTVSDIYDALTAADRPYKKPTSRKRAFAVLYDMADRGKLDKTVIDRLKEALEDYTDADIKRMSEGIMSEDNTFFIKI